MPSTEKSKYIFMRMWDFCNMEQKIVLFRCSELIFVNNVPLEIGGWGAVEYLLDSALLVVKNNLQGIVWSLIPL